MSSASPTGPELALTDYFQVPFLSFQTTTVHIANVLLLGIETATDACSVALFEGDTLLAELSVSEPRSHAAQLVPLIHRLFRDCGRSPVELDVIAVSAGPGSYTGLRIGASTAKGLAFAADAALVAVPSLEALAFGAYGASSFPILVVFPSRRGEVYAAVYQAGTDGFREVREPAAVDVSTINDWLPTGTLHIVGTASQTVMEQIGDPNRFRFLEIRPSAVNIARMGLQRYNAGLVENVAAWEPYYLKAFIAKPPRPIFG